MTRHPGGGALAEWIAALEAERLAPVPRADASACGTRVATACVRLEAAIRRHATHEGVAASSGSGGLPRKIPEAYRRAARAAVRRGYRKDVARLRRAALPAPGRKGAARQPRDKPAPDLHQPRMPLPGDSAS
jgi:hypothetical protein